MRNFLTVGFEHSSDSNVFISSWKHQQGVISALLTLEHSGAVENSSQNTRKKQRKRYKGFDYIRCKFINPYSI